MISLPYRTECMLFLLLVYKSLDQNMHRTCQILGLNDENIKADTFPLKFEHLIAKSCQ